MSLEGLSPPALFVYGGTFSDYVKEKRKFSRFSTLACFSEAASSCTSEGSTCNADELVLLESEIMQLYGEARAKDIGTVRTIEMPECSTKIVNLVDVARFIQQSRADCDCVGEGEDAEADEELPWEGDGACAEEHNPVMEQQQSKSDGFTKDTLEIQKPLVYAGTFEQYKKESSKFIRFRTMQAFSSALCETRQPDMSCTRINAAEEQPASAINATKTMPSMLDCTIEVDSSMNDKRQVIFDTHIMHPFSACQLVALATPPSLVSDVSMYMTLSDVSVRAACSLSVAEAKAAVRKAVADLGAGNDNSDQKEERAHAQVPASKLGLTCQQRAYRFKFAADQLEAIGSKTAGGIFTVKDDGSNWVVDHGSSYAHQRRRGHSSASAWGGGSTTLEPIAHAKVSLSHNVSFTLPKLSAAYSRDASESERPQLGSLCSDFIF